MVGGEETNLPVLGFSGEHHGIFRLRDLAIVNVLDILGLLLGLDAIILRKSALVASTAGVGEEVRANRLDAALNGSRKVTQGLEVLVGSPALREDGERKGDEWHGEDEDGDGGGGGVWVVEAGFGG